MIETQQFLTAVSTKEDNMALTHICRVGVHSVEKTSKYFNRAQRFHISYLHMVQTGDSDTCSSYLSYKKKNESKKL